MRNLNLKIKNNLYYKITSDIERKKSGLTQKEFAEKIISDFYSGDNLKLIKIYFDRLKAVDQFYLEMTKQIEKENFNLTSEEKDKLINKLDEIIEKERLILRSIQKIISKGTNF
ncbi:MAG: hypothetical protein Q4B52_05465 [Tissierellia bacterium]|nr:hypothetical protein [Tissierellia bacterium]